MKYFFFKRRRVLITSDNNYLIMNSQSNNILEEHCDHCKRSATECEKNTERERNPITHWEGTDADYCDDCYYNHYAEEVDSDEEEEVDSDEEEEVDSDEEEEQEQIYLSQITLGLPLEGIKECLEYHSDWCDVCGELTHGIMFCGECGSRQSRKCYEPTDNENIDFFSDEKKSCKHIYECGCDKDYCDSCKEEMGEEDDELNISWCDDEGCKHYYKNRNDNCNCAGIDCGFCK